VISKEMPAAVPLPMAHLPPTEMGRVLQGQRLGHYELQEFVGGGGMGAVFRALDTMLDRIVAVKVLSRVQSNDEETLRRFKNEAQSAARLDHENIGRVHYVGEDQGWHYIVFEFIEGINLRDVVDRDGPLPLADAVSYTLQVTDALAHAAQRDVVHRDIKPSNVLVTPGGRAKLVDMGLARLHQVEHSGDDLTASGVTLGTFDYISPEQARDPRNADVRSDIYSLGCTLYFMLTGRPPFPDGTVLQKLLQHQGEEPSDPRMLRPDLPDELLKVLRRMLVKVPQQRYQRPEALIRDLMAVATKLGLPAPAISSPLSTPRSEPRPLVVRHLPWLVPVAALLLIAIIEAVVSRWSNADVTPPPIRHAAAAGAGATLRPGDTDRNVATQNGDNAKSADGEKSANPPTGPHRSSTATDRALPPSPANGNELSARSSKSKTAGRSPPSDDQDVAAADKSAATTDPIKPARSGGPEDASRRSAAPLAPAEAAIGAAPTAADAADLHKLIQRWLKSLLAAERGGDSSAAVRVPWDPAAASATVAASNSERSPRTATNTDPFAAPPADRKGLLIVSRSHEGLSDYTSVGEACRAAKSGDVIELRYSGRLDNRPIAFSGQRLTIRAGDGYSPVINFVPRESDLAQSRSMISLGGSQLSLINLQLELDVPREVVSQSWTLSEIRPGESIRLDGCTLTVRNASDSGAAYQPDVAFFDIRAVPGQGVMALRDAAMVRPAALLQLKNCIVRGEALFLRANELQPAQIAWENGLLATSERFLAATGGPSDPKPQGQVQIELRHVTAFVHGGFTLLTATPDAPLELPLEINANDCIFVGRSAAPLIEQSGVDEPEDLRKHVTWNGDRNFYDGFGTFWRIGGPGGAETTVEMTFSDWQGFWGPREIQPSADQVVWQKLPAGDRPANQHRPTDYALRGGENPAHSAASDGHDAGVEADQLPAVKD
jgi:serine/threonine-protein kinase